MPANIVLRNLSNPPVKGNVEPIIATREDLRSGARGDSGEGLPPISAGQRVITGSGFGQGPNVVLFDSMSAGSDGQDVDFTNGPEIGQWTGDSAGLVAGAIAGAKYYAYNDRLWFAGRDPNRLAENAYNMQGLVFVHDTEFTEFRLAHRTLIPTGFLMPGTSTPNSNDNVGSNWKQVWAGTPETGWGPVGTGPDCLFPSLAAANTVKIQGNTISPNKQDGKQLYSNLSGVSENFFSWYQKPGTGQYTNDGFIEVVRCNDIASARERHGNANPFAVYNGSPTKLAYRNLIFNAWIGNAPVYSNILMLWSDMYLAVGENSAACVLLGDAPALAGCSNVSIIPPDLWTDTEIRVSPRAWEDHPYAHLVLSNGTLLENVGGQ